MSSEIRNVGHKPRRWVRFSLGTFLAAFTLVSLWLGWETYQARWQRATVARILAAGGFVGYEQEIAKAAARAKLKRSLKGAPLPEETPTMRDKIAATLGRDYFDSPVQVRFVDIADLTRPDMPQITPDLLARVAGLRRLELLDLSFNETVTDELLVHLSGLANLKTLQFYNSSIHGPGLAYVARLPKLEYLDLSHSLLDDDGLTWVGQMKSLTRLSIGYTKITDVGLAHLEQLPLLDTVSLRSTAVTDECLKLLAKLPKFKAAQLQHTRVTPDAVARFQKEYPKHFLQTGLDFGMTPADVDWRLDAQPSAATVNARLKVLGIHGAAKTDPAKPDGPVTSLTLGPSSVSDAAVLELVAKLPTLYELTIGSSVVGDDLLRGLAGNGSIGMLCLPSTRVTDEGLQYLSEMPNLRYLVFNEDAITDEGLMQHVAKLKELKGITLQDSDVSAAGVRALQKALPGCEVKY